MSLFANPNKKLTDALVWFNHLKSEIQSHLIAEVDQSDNNFSTEQTNNLTIIALEILSASATYPKDQVVARLVELGMNNVYATLLVDKVLTKPALAQLDVKRLLCLSDEKYAKALETIIVKLYVENNSTQQMLEYSGLTNEELEAALRLMRDQILFKYVRGELSHQNLGDLLVGLLKFPKDRVQILVDLLEQHKQAIFANYLFRNTQDVYFNIQVLMKNQEATLGLLKELVAFLKKKFDQPQGSQSFIT